MATTIKAANINSSYIRYELGFDADLTYHGSFGDGENSIRVYSFRGGDGYTYRVADTNAEPVWEEADPDIFAELLNSVQSIFLNDGDPRPL